jgi:RNA polymerase sigma factor (sigma-70 family)
MTHEERITVFGRLRNRYLGFLTAVLWRLTGDRELFAEAMQYALMGLWQHAEKLEGEKAPSYLYRIALSANAKAWRQRIGRDGNIAPDAAGSDDGSETRMQRADLLARVRQTIARLPNKQGRALVMRYFDQKDYATIAADLGCSEVAARSHVSKAVATLRGRLAPRTELGIRP